MSTHTPTRMCIACRTRKEKPLLLRFVFDGRLILDAKQKHPGRGAYICGEKACMQKIIKKNMLGYALHATLSTEDKALLEGCMHE